VLRTSCLLLLAGALAAHDGAQACGYDGVHGAGLLNFGYPGALQVGTAVWQAQQQGLIERTEPLGAMASPAVRMLGYRQMVGNLQRLSERIAATDKPPPDFVVVLLRPMLWTRFAAAGMQLHAEGAATGEVVVITDEPVLTALLAGKLDLRDAIDLGLLRLYGPGDKAAELSRLLGMAMPARRETTSGRDRP
jgi:hypothetical protein